MKKTLLLILFFILFIGCKSDNFYNTKRTLETDKAEYNLGDVINLTLKIVPLKEQMEIRVFENYKNLEIYFSLFNEKEGNHSRSKHSGKFLPETKTRSITISKLRPFVKTFVGTINERGNIIEIHFPELKIKAAFNREKLKTDTIRIHGLCNPINPEFGASIEEYFENTDIKININ